VARRVLPTRIVSTIDQIFIAEDNAADVNLLRIALRESRVECELAVFCDGASALAAVVEANLRPSLFILDVNLPNVNGIAILARIRTSTVFGRTPVIVWTTSDAPEDKMRSEKCGADKHVCKPTDLASFLRIGELVRQTIAAARPVAGTNSPG
jgi:DNA-binding response OmpR family regulator